MTYEILLPAIAVAVVVGITRHKLRHEFIVAEGFTGLLYHQGKFVESLTPGRHVRWGRHFSLAPIDLRRSLMTIAGQDLLTADSVGLKLSLVVDGGQPGSAQPALDSVGDGGAGRRQHLGARLAGRVRAAEERRSTSLRRVCARADLQLNSTRAGASCIRSRLRFCPAGRGAAHGHQGGGLQSRPAPAHTRQP